jgi:hypothetical protein
MALTAVLSTGLAQTDTTQATQIVRGTITFAGNYVTGGEILNLALYGVQSNYPPLNVFVYEYPLNGGAAFGSTFIYTAGTDPSNGRLMIFAGGVQQTTATPYQAYSNVSFEAVFALGN